MTFLFWLALISLVLIITVTIEIAYGMKVMTKIRDISILAPNYPKVSIIIPACNEAKSIEPALQSVLMLDYPDLEIIVINDRSTDETGEVLKSIQQKNSKILIHEIKELPGGWLGKTHAMQKGADQASGDYLLFTDADIIMEPSTLKRAISHVQKDDLDHLSIFFENIAPGAILNSLLIDICGGLMMLFKPWKVKNKKSKKFMGVGAFNLVKTSVYRTIDGHRSFSMHPIDDIMLGKVIKRKGFSQDCILGHGFVQVKWYSSVKELIDGLTKNTFAAYNFNILYVLIGCLFVFMVSVLPLWGLLFSSGTSQFLFGAAVITRLLSVAHGYSYTKFSSLYSVLSLISPYINIYMALRAMIITLKNDGIDWRGTHYSLDEIKDQGKLY